jgi:serine/threonine protein kinase
MSGIKAYFRCMFRALRDIHARGIIHRDVKPANFLFDPRRGTGTLCDFGLASVMSLHATISSDTNHTCMNSAWTLVRHSAHVCTHQPRENIPMVRHDPGRSTTLTKSRRCRRKQDKRAHGRPKRSDIPRRTLGESSQHGVRRHTERRTSTGHPPRPTGQAHEASVHLKSSSNVAIRQEVRSS